MSVIRNLNIGPRLGLGFGLLLVLLAVALGLSVTRLAQLGDTIGLIVGEEWAKAGAAATIDTTTRANARRTMELFFVRDAAHAASVRERISHNKKIIDEALATLDRLVHREDAKAVLAELKIKRRAYVASFTRVDQLLAAGHRDDAEHLLQQETLPAIDALQVHVAALVSLQNKVAMEAGAAAQASVERTSTMLWAIGAALLALGAAAAWWLSRSITRPLEAAVKVAETVAAGDLGSRIEVTSRDETGRLMQALQAMNASLARVVAQVRDGSENIATGSTQIASGTTDLSQRTEEQAANLQQTAASMEQLASTVAQSAQAAHAASRMAVQASEAVAQGGEAVGRVVGTMEEITAASRRIGDIIGVIDNIAFQTNILALNAAVEAARAGEQGRGFAVVASEVRNLARRSAEAAREIKGLIGTSVEKVEAGSVQVSEAGRAMQGIVLQVRQVSELITQISSTAAEQTQGIEQVNQAVSQLDQVTQQNASLVEESAAASESLKEQAGRLVESVRAFRLGGLQAA
jgi:methyl-accepting chemotaxis protein